RREAEALVLPDLPAFLAGRYEPRDADERVAMTAACRFLGSHAAGARLWADAIAADPGRAAAGRRHAVIAAALAAGDAGGLAEADRARWRARARGWIAEEVAAAEEAFASGPDGRARLRETLEDWTTSGHLAGVRDRPGIDLLPGVERAEWAALWGKVDALLRRAREPG
ncbi:MAG TPA: hypothetical protein VF796_26640, partial [Humisphaera sp.]